MVVVEAANGIPLLTPPDQVYESAPDPLSVTDFPEQTVDDGEIVDPTLG